MACFLKYASLSDSSFDGFNLFCSRRCSNLSSRKSIGTSIPPSLKQFFRNFDDCCELQGFPNPEPLILKSIAISGVPVDDIPCIDIWSSSSQVYTSAGGGEGDEEQDDESRQHWDEEEVRAAAVGERGRLADLVRFDRERSVETIMTVLPRIRRRFICHKDLSQRG